MFKIIRNKIREWKTFLNVFRSFNAETTANDEDYAKD